MSDDIRGYFNRDLVLEYYPRGTTMIQPMGIWQIPNSKKHKAREIITEKQNDYFAEIKKDGNWYAVSVTTQGVFLFARTVSKKTGLLVEKGQNVPHIIESFKKLPAGTYIEGELYYPNGNSDLVRTIMGCNADKAIARQNGEDLKYNATVGNFNNEPRLVHYYIHNIIRYGLESLIEKTNLERYNFLKEIYEKELKDNPYIELADIIMPDECNFFDKANELIDKGEEGLVLKKINGLYYPDQKKAWETIKIKREDSIDAICLGFEEPTKYYEGDCPESWQYWININDGSKVQGNYHNIPAYVPITKNYYYGWIGAITFGVYGEQGEIINLGSVSSGLTDDIKQEIKNNFNSFIMQPILLECMEIYHGTSIRSPRFIKFRDDINIQDCTINKLL